jgi:signal peptidase II
MKMKTMAMRTAPPRASNLAGAGPMFERIAVPLAVAGILDLLSKRAILASYAVDERRTIVPRLLDFTYVRNAHGAMGLFGDRPVLLIALAVGALAVLWYLLRTTLVASPLAQVGFGLVAGGALGNVTDRIVHGYVIDFVSVPHFYVFNLADTAITIGLVLIALPTLGRRGAAVST